MSTVTSGGDAASRRSVEQRRVELIDAAVAVLAEDGLGRATTRAITDRAGLALGAFHYAFDSKDQLLEAVIDRVAATTTGRLQATLDEVAGGDEPTTASGATRVAGYLRRFLTRYWDQLADTPGLQLAQYELTVHALREPGMHGVAARQYDHYVDTLAAGIAQVHGAPRDDATDDLARFVVATLDGLLLQRLADGDADRSRRQLRHYVEAVEAVVTAHLDPEH